MKKIIVSDVTLKVVEEQGVSLTFREKLAIAEKLDASGVDAIELPLFIDSKENEIVYRTIASAVKNATVKIPVGFDVDGVEVAASCVKDAKKSCLQIALPVSTAQMEYFYHVKAPVMQQKIAELVSAAASKSQCVEFVALDAFRAEDGVIETFAKVAAESGAKCITVCDDAGVAFPEDYAAVVQKIKSACGLKVFVQPSNALSMAAASAVAAIKAGADGVKTSVVGEYLSLSVVSDIFRAKKFTLDADCAVDATNVKAISAIVDGIVDDAFDGAEQKNQIGKIMGATATMSDVATAIKDLGYELSDSDIGKAITARAVISIKRNTLSGFSR